MRSRVLAAVCALALTVPTALASAPAQAVPVAAAAASEAAVGGPVISARKAVKPRGKCRSRQLNLRKPVQSGLFAKCVVKAMQRGRTATVVTRHNPGETSKGPMRFGKHTDASVSYSNGTRLVVIGTKTWYRPAGKGWVRPGTGSDDEVVANMVAKLWRGAASAASYRSVLRSSSTGWTWSGKVRKLNGVRARQYVGTIKVGDMAFSHYSVWVDALDRPIRIQSTGTAYGVTVTTVQDFKKWTKKVSIKAPTKR